MPRSTRDSEEEVDPKPGRKSRLTDVVSVDSPLRRSSRIKSVKQNESSPESLSSDTSNVSNTQTRVTRKRTSIMDNTTTTEKQKSLRSRMNSVSSDVSEATENGTNTMTPTKRNRNSIIGDVFNKTNNRRSTQFTRAGSESKTSPIRVTRNTRSSSMEPESFAGNKHMDKNEQVCVRTPGRMRRPKSIVPSEATVIEEKEENMKVLLVSLDCTLPNVSEVKETDLNDPLKSTQKHDPMSSAEDNLNSNCQSVNEKSIENISVNELPNNIAEKLKEEESANDSPTLKNKPTQKSESNKQKSESIQETCNKDQGSEAVEETRTELDEEVPKKEEESGNDSTTLKNKPTEKSESDEQKSEAIQETSNKNQESKVVEGNDSDIVATNSIQDIPATEWKEKNVANDSVFEIRNTEDTDDFDYTSKLAVQRDSLSEPILNVSSDKNVPLKISSDLSSCESLELVQCMDDVMTTDDEKLTEASITLNKETTEVHNEESNEIVNDSTVSIVEKAVNANKESGKDNIKSNTRMNDQDDVREEVNKPDTSGNVQNDDEISCTNTCSSPNLTNTVPLTSSDNMSAANTECSPILKNNTNGAKSTNANQDSVTDVVKSSPPSTVIEPAVTSTELDENLPKKELKEEESTNDLSTLKNKPAEKSESDEQKSEFIQETCNKNQGSEAAESNDSDITATDLFQDIPDAEWKEKNSAKSTNAVGDSVTDVVRSSLPLTVTETPTELNEEVSKKEELKEKESVNDSATLKNKPTEKLESDEQKSESIQETCNKNQGSEAAESNDSDIAATDLFQDIPATEWKEKNTDVDKNSIHLVSTERFENEMETKCDLVLIDKEALLAAENMKAAKEKEASDYDLDDTVVLKMQRDSLKAQKNGKTKMNKSVDKMNDSKNAASDENDIDNEATNTKDFKDKRENENQDKSITEQRTEHSASKHNVSSRKLLERKSLNESHKITEAEENLSESIPKKQKSLNKSTSKADVSRKSLNKSIQKEIESESVISTSAKKGKEKRSLNISRKKQRNCIEESDTEAKDSSISEKKGNAKKKFSRKRSAVRTIETNSDDSKSESGDSANKTIELPKFMLGEAFNIDSNESDKSMDSDIEKEYNLGGKDTSKFSDDDVQEDECRASETESSDPEDNGSDLEDFIVDDVEEDEGSEEGEKANEKIEIEELHTDESTQENQEKEIKEQDEAMHMQEPDVMEDKIKEGMTEEESQNENEEENIEDVDKLIDSCSRQKSKLEISDRLSTSKTNRRKKLKKVDTSQSEKSKKENSLSDLSLKQKVLSAVDNILEVDRRKKHKKRKQTAEKINTTILIEDSFFEDIDSQIVSKDKNVSTTNADKDKKVEEVSLNEENKKQRITHTDINKDVEEVLHKETNDKKTKITKKPKKIKKKQEKEITENLPDICSGNQVSGKKKNKISEPLSNEEIPTTKISKKRQKLPKDIAVQDDGTAVEKLPKKKKKLASKDASSQENVSTKKLLKKKQNLSSNDTSEDKNISTEKLSKKQHKLVEKDTKSEVKPVKKSNKSRQSTDIASDSNEGPTVVKFSEAREETLKAVKCISDSIKVNKENKKKKQKERMQEVELENEKPKPKKQKIEDNKSESTKGIKRLSDEFLENLSDVPSKPLKKRKLLKMKNQILPSRSMFDLKANKVENVDVEEDFDMVSSYGGTTQFAVENIQKMKKKKKVPGVVSFKQKMIARNPRQPVSAYLMYLEKQKIAGKDRFCNKPY